MLCTLSKFISGGSVWIYSSVRVPNACTSREMASIETTRAVASCVGGATGYNRDVR